MEDSSTYPIIHCSNSSCKKVESTDIIEGYYLEGSTSTEEGYINLITCTISPVDGLASDCVIKSPSPGYYVNAEMSNSIDAIIYCTRDICEVQSPPTSPAYYVGIEKNKKKHMD